MTFAKCISTNQQPPQRGVAVPDPFGLGQNGCWPSQESQLPWALPSHKTIFLSCCPLKDHRRAACSFKIGLLSFPFSCLFLARLHLLILLLLMNGNVHPNTGPIFSFSMCAGNVTRWGRLVQCCTCSQWVYLRC